MQPTTSPLDPTDPVLSFILLVACQSSYWLSWRVYPPEVLYTWRVEPSVGPDNTRRVLFLFPTVLTAVPAGPPPKTMTKEWQEASNERARELNLDPITGECSRSLVPIAGIPGSFQFFFFRCSVRGLFREGFCAIQVDSRRTRAGSRADPLECALRLCFILAHNQIFKYFFAIPRSPHATMVWRSFTVGWYVFRV